MPTICQVGQLATHVVPAKLAIGVAPEHAVHAKGLPVLTDPAAQAETHLVAPVALNACPVGQVLRHVIPSTAVKVGAPVNVLQATHVPPVVEGLASPCPAAHGLHCCPVAATVVCSHEAKGRRNKSLVYRVAPKEWTPLTYYSMLDGSIFS